MHENDYLHPIGLCLSYYFRKKVTYCSRLHFTFSLYPQGRVGLFHTRYFRNLFNLKLFDL